MSVLLDIKQNKITRGHGGENVPSHGALSKAGKVRNSTPKVDAKDRKTTGPRISNRKLHYKRIVLEQNSKTRFRRRR